MMMMIATAVFAEALGNLQDFTWLISENRRYTYACFEYFTDLDVNLLQTQDYW
jgi:hypothetical protein